MSHCVPTETPWLGSAKLALMGASVARECLADLAPDTWGTIPVLLCVAEHSRPGRSERLDDELFAGIEELLETSFARESGVIARRRASVAVALAQARKRIYEGNAPAVLIVGVDSLISWPAMRVAQARDRLLTAENSNGFIPGEAAAALLVCKPMDGATHLRIEGLGFAVESAHLESGEPLRGDGLTLAIAAALKEARCEMHDLDFRVTDLSGEQYYFKEAALAFNRLLHKRKEDFQLWHPAECTGEVGAAAGVICVGFAAAAAAGGFAPGRGVLLHMGNDDGARVGIVAFGG